MPDPEPKVGIKNPIWTKSKAKLIEKYLYYFVMITKHGTYIDGFAGPQKLDKPAMWSAKLVLESEPRWFRNFYLYDKDEFWLDCVGETFSLVDHLVKNGSNRVEAEELVQRCYVFVREQWPDASIAKKAEVVATIGAHFA